MSLKQMLYSELGMPNVGGSSMPQLFSMSSAAKQYDIFNRPQQPQQQVIEPQPVAQSAFAGQEPTPVALTARTNPVVTPDGNIHVNDQFINGKMYNSYTGRSGSKADRNNNQGNLSGIGGLGYGASRIMHSKYGDKGDQKQLAFKDAASGWRGMHTLMSQKNYNNAPIRSAFSKYQSDQKAWGNMIASLQKKGVNVDGTFNQLSPEQKITFMNDRARHEGWTGDPLTHSILYGGS